jgi:hypothetical protein
LTYVRRDVEIAIDVAEAALAAGRLKWITQRGRPAEMRLFYGWLTVPQAMQLPLPDTSWMSDPPTHESHVRWMTARLIAMEQMFLYRHNGVARPDAKR